jgi:hypothetical protein
MVKFLSVSLIMCCFSQTIIGQNFKNINEIVSISQKKPSDLEKALVAKGFRYESTEKSRQLFSHTIGNASISYELAPRVFEYTFYDRQFYLDAFSRVQKADYLFSKGEVISLENSKKYTADKFSKDGTVLYFLQISEKGKSDQFKILIYPSSSGKSASKNDFGYGNFYVGLVLPKGILGESPSPQGTVEQAFVGNSGMGAGKGVELGFSGISGFYSINKSLPYFVDFGLHMRALAGFQPYALASSTFNYKNFGRFGAGGGPSISFSPFRNSDLSASFFYDFIPTGNFGGNMEYNGSDATYSNTVKRNDVSFALARNYGFELKYESLMFGLEKSNFTDKGVFDKQQGYNGNISSTTINAGIPFQQAAVKFGFVF